MNIQAAQKQLATARKQACELREHIATLRQSIIKAGGITHHTGIDHFKRNKKMYRQWKTGRSLKDIAKDASISLGRAREICKRIDRVLEYKGIAFKKYQSLLKYYEMAKRS
ncbi:MAG: hypothetical protein JSS64_12150 [Bacteroidetes bacterium]|nr:hypothetical protein [Bacteroidota bacterium]